MASDAFKMGMAGAFFGAGQALAEIGKEKTAETGVAYNLYIKLSQDPKFKKIGEWEYKRGMTRSQVMQGFEEDPEQIRTTSGSRKLTQSELDFLFPDQGLEEGEGLTVDTARIKAQMRGQTLTRKTSVQKMALQTFEAELRRGMQTEAGKVKILNTLTKMHIEDVNERLADPTVGPLIKELFNRADFQTEERYKGFRKKIFETFGSTPFTRQPFETKPTTPRLPIDELMRKYNYDDNILIPILIEMGEIQPEQAEDYRKKIQQLKSIKGQQITTPGITETGTAGIGQDLRLGQPTLAPPSAIQSPGAGVQAQGAGVPAPGLTSPGTSPSSFMPKATPYNRLKTLAYLRNIPRQR